MSKEKQTTPETTQEERKKGSFLIRQDYLKTACHFLDDNSLGAVFRNIYQFIINPNHEAQLQPLPNMCYFQLTEGIKEENIKYYKILEKRKANYLDMKNRAAQFGKNNSNKTDENEKTDEIEKNNSSLRIGKDSIKDSNMEGNAEDSNAMDSNATVGSGTQDTNVSVSNKEYSIKNRNIFLNNEVYTRNYLREKKMFLKEGARKEFWAYNNDELQWPYKPETAFRRWIKRHPQDEMKPKETKKAPDLPATPAPLLAFENEFKEALREVIFIKDFKTFFEGLRLIKISESINGDKILFATQSKFNAEYIRENYANNIEQTYLALKSRKCLGVDFCFVDNYAKELKYLMTNVFDVLTKDPAEEKTTPMPESLKEHLKNLTSQNVYNKPEAEASNNK